MFSVKIDKKTLSMAIDEELAGSIEEIADELPENSPRYLILSHPLVSQPYLFPSLQIG